MIFYGNNEKFFTYRILNIFPFNFFLADNNTRRTLRGAHFREIEMFHSNCHAVRDPHASFG
jgi:hypothetical protein